MEGDGEEKLIMPEADLRGDQSRMIGGQREVGQVEGGESAEIDEYFRRVALRG